MSQFEGSENISRKDQDVPSAHNRLLDDSLNLTKERPADVLSNGLGGTPDEIRRVPFSPDADKGVQYLLMSGSRPDSNDIAAHIQAGYRVIPFRIVPAVPRLATSAFPSPILKPIEEPKK